MSTLRNLRAKVAVATIGMGLAASAALAAPNGYVVDVTLPQSVSVGNTTLPGGQYKINEIPIGSSGESMFVFRDGNGNTAAVAEGNKIVQPTDVDAGGASKKTQILLSPSEDGAMRLNEMFIEGDSIGYSFQ